jgi:hypothetical protein
MGAGSPEEAHICVGRSAARQPDYAIKGADQDAFRAYRRQLDAKTRPAGEARAADWLNGLKTDVEILMTSELGNEQAQMACALLYLSGHMGPVNVYESAIGARDILGQDQSTMLSMIYGKGSDLQSGIIAEIEGKDDEAIECYHRAALTREKEAILRYGALLLRHWQEEDGLGPFRMLANIGNMAANYNLAMRSNESMAMHYVVKCCDMGSNVDFPEAYYV